ncbi:MAG: PEGA domain-containing protein [Candidatus Aminicenantes bacterium]|nr:PEGA domain-containing protein [Candidatus Aminicenantes bacterium]
MKKKTPWLLIGAAVVVGAAALYFLVLKKPKYTLTVSLTGATGNPAATEKYKKGTVVSYNYSLQSGYVNLAVKLDGVAVASSGTVTMDKDHTLTVTAVQGAAIQVNSTPTGAKIFLDNVDTGLTTNATVSGVTPGSHTVKLTKSGYYNYSTAVTTTSGQTATVNATLYRDVTGKWSGTTNQGYPMFVNVSGSTVNSYNIKMKLTGGIGTLTLEVTGWGTYSISNGSFTISTTVGTGGSLKITGKFNSAGTALTGTWSCNYLSAWGYFTGSGTYNATKSGSMKQVVRPSAEGVRILEERLN